MTIPPETIRELREALAKRQGPHNESYEFTEACDKLEDLVVEHLPALLEAAEQHNALVKAALFAHGEIVSGRFAAAQQALENALGMDFLVENHLTKEGE